MILIVGSEGAGKREYALGMGYAENDIAEAVLNDKPVLDKLHILVAEDPKAAPDLLDALLEKEVVICNEVGSGIIPLKREERDAREATGRLCVLLAQKAERVVRVVCGIPIFLK